MKAEDATALTQEALEEYLNAVQIPGSVYDQITAAAKERKTHLDLNAQALVGGANKQETLALAKRYIEKLRFDGFRVDPLNSLDNVLVLRVSWPQPTLKKK